MTEIADRASALLGDTVIETRPLAGGDLSTVCVLTLADGRTVVAKTGPLVAVEAKMLRAIRATDAPAPEVFGVGDDLLLIEHLPADGHLTESAWRDLASVLDQLYGTTGERYGWPDDYAFGAVTIRNTSSDDWPDFWAAHRLRCHLPCIDTAVGRRIERLSDVLGDHVSKRPRAVLLHGDLWGGNILVSGDRISGLIDPACYHGDREVDAAMLTLSDHPPRAFFDALALEPGWAERQPVYRLWPLLVHLRLFGDGYLHAVDACLSQLGV